MHQHPLVTVICLCYNHEKFVVDALDSVIKQEYSNIELLIVDDCSSDNSVGVIENWLTNQSKITFLKNSKNLGNTKTFNNALQLAKGDYILDLAADDRLLPNCISTQIKTFQNSKYSKLGIVYANFNLINEDGSFKSVYYNENENPRSGNVYEMVIGRKVKLGSIAALYKTEVLRKIGGYDETLAYEDLDAWVRISRHYDVEYIAIPLAEKRELDSSLSAQFSHKSNPKTKLLHKSTLEIFNKILVLNKSKRENKIVINRMQFELRKFISAREWILTFKLVLLMLKAFFRSF